MLHLSLSFGGHTSNFGERVSDGALDSGGGRGPTVARLVMRVDSPHDYTAADLARDLHRLLRRCYPESHKVLLFLDVPILASFLASCAQFSFLSTSISIDILYQ